MNWDGLPVDFNATVNYTCERGMKFEDDFDLSHQEALCNPGNTWTEPPWKTCVESKQL